MSGLPLNAGGANESDLCGLDSVSPDSSSIMAGDRACLLRVAPVPNVSSDVPPTEDFRIQCLSLSVIRQASKDKTMADEYTVTRWGAVDQTTDPSVFVQNPDRVAVVPIMDDRLLEIGVGPFGNRLKEIDAHDLAAIGNRASSQSGSASDN
jgi:hypothetical protein